MPVPLEWWQEWSEGWFILGAPYAALRAPLTITDPLPGPSGGEGNRVAH